jgi:hypothetical protein
MALLRRRLPALIGRLRQKHQHRGPGPSIGTVAQLSLKSTLTMSSRGMFKEIAMTDKIKTEKIDSDQSWKNNRLAPFSDTSGSRKEPEPVPSKSPKPVKF